MPAVQYPFIDIAVHERVREKFAKGEALALFSMDLKSALWANGRGAALFGTPMIYDFIEHGPKAQDVTFRQVAGAASRLHNIGDRQQFMIRVPSGFRSVAVSAALEVIEVERQQPVLLFSAMLDQSGLSPEERAWRMIEGFDDPDIHMAVMDESGAIIAASAKFADLEIAPQTARTLISMAARHASKLVKRPVPTGKGYLPAATAQLTQEPVLNLVFVVETALGRLDPSSEFIEERPEPKAVPVEEQAELASKPSQQLAFESVLDAVAQIEETDDEQQEMDEHGVAEAISNEDQSVFLTYKQDTDEELETVEALSPADDFVLADEKKLAAVSTPDEEPSYSATADNIDDAQSLEDGTSEAQEAHFPEAAEPQALTIDTHEPTDEPAPPSSFVFNPNGRASRFVWKIDAAGCFSSISHEFAEAVGPKAAAVEGMSFSDLTALFNLDPEGKIAELLKRRDTWSGKTIYWPVEGTSLAVPIDLAALPTYTRAREFDGFRGFGIVRIADAVEDPHAAGLVLAGESHPDNELTIAEEQQDDAAAVEPDVSADVTPTHVEEPVPFSFVDEDGAEAEAEAEADAVETDVLETDSVPEEPQPQRFHQPPEHEVPVLKIAEKPVQSYSDKVVHIDEHRNRRDGLTASEQAAFREIGRTLKPVEDDEATPFVSEDAPSDDRAEEISVEAEAEDAVAAAVETDDAKAEAEEPVVATDAVHADQPSVPTEDDAFHAYTRGDEPVAFTHPPIGTRMEGGHDEDEDEHDTAAAEEPATQDEDVDPAIDEEEVALGPSTRLSTGLTPETVDQMPVALLIHSGDRLIHANPEFLRLTGYTDLDELTALGGLDALLQREELDNVSERSGGMVAVSAENELIPVRAKLQSVRWEEASALMLSLIPTETVRDAAPVHAADVTGEEPTTDNAEDSDRMKGEIEELHSILETATDGVVLLDEDGSIRSLNRSASALFNYDSAEISNKPFVTLFAHESQRAVLDYLSGLANNGVASVLNDGREVIGREASGGFLPLFMTIGRLKSTNGYCAVIRDITQWKRTEEDLRNAKRAAETANAHKTDFLARVSHEIRTPLNAIIGFADMMATERFGPIGHPRYIEYSNDIVRSGRHVLDIVNDLLDISKIEAGQMDVDFKAVALNETIAEAVSLVQPQANNQRVIIRTALSQSVPPVVADLRSIKQILLNILSNAIKFTPSGGQIVVSTAYEANGSVVLRVRDTGIGMTRSELEQAMKPFRQVSASSSRVRGDGTGLGLPLTKAMVDANRANFSITSTPNEGTLVEISFPSQRVLAN
ncbi:PAS domain-containing sensor histidine kinase [Rhizobium rhizogenes]|uniref:histidine kinase n=1 Tax=Rhizobium rhizogenes TaxID=359 RepID=A0AA92H993_RHIRH|nr:PAS domain-containing sensor histidine kinase [Rhizobium rhizogenes]PVE54166.1 PAS domain-containing sensor histidine kinase [Rhizobium rhizogenes]PVE66658.1 PAS domain-containing sensor histidine kinase [Agrobacterium tumefaciens]PVE76646.1 PAS domain-containing sensor histidine kinase [Sphingomonas sp. TPD3009]